VFPGPQGGEPSEARLSGGALIVLGRIVAPFGVQGWVKVHPFGDDPDAWRKMPRWWLGSDPEGTAWQAYELTSLRQHGKGLVAKLAGVDDRAGAEGIDGRYIAAPREALPETGEQEYYWADLIGLDVVNEQGERLGKVATLIETGANDVLVVRDGEGTQMRERLLPFVGEVVKEVTSDHVSVAWGKDW
jgi:16S rRNA processing protein RimM